MRDLKQEFFIGCDLGRAIDDAGRRNEPLDRDRVGEAVFVMLAGDRVYRGIEMRAGVFAHLQVVPVPGRATIVVMRDPGNAEWLRRRQRRWQLNDRRRRPQRLGQIDDADRTVGDLIHLFESAKEQRDRLN
jgi:hypothetical protein